MQNQYVEYYKNKSYIFNRSQSSMSDNLQEGDRQSILSNLLRIQGVEGHDGSFFDTGSQSWRQCRIRQTEEELNGLKKEYERYCDMQVKTGHKRPSIYPANLDERRQQLQARLEVHRKEAKYLRDLLEKTPDPKVERAEMILHPKHWSRGQLRDGVLVSIGGIKVAPDPDGLLRISDSRSPYDGMEVWRFKALIVNSMHHEHRIRDKEELAASRTENRPFKQPPWPKPGKWNRENDQVEYEDYHPEVIRKVKRNSE